MVIVVPILFIVMVVSTFRLSRRIWDVVDTPTVSPSGALIGRCEVSGKAALFKPDHDFRTTVTSPISRVDCVWFDVIVEEYVQQGKSSYWRGIARHRYENGFDIYDEHGSILVEVPDSGYEFQSRYRHDENEMVRLAAFNHFHPGEKSKSEGWTPSPDGYFMWHDNLNRWIPTQYVSADGEQYYDDSTGAWTPVSKPSFLSSVADFVGDSLSGHWDKRRVRVSEYVVYPDEEIFVHGIVGVRDNSSQLKIGHGDSRDPMRVSCKGEESVLSRLKRFRIAAWLGALGLGIGTIFIGDDTFATYFGIDINVVSVFIVAGIAFVVMWIFLVFFRAYNRFIRLRQQVAMSNSTIGICEKRRFELIPQLCDVIDGVTKHEQEVQTRIAALRQSADLSNEIMFLAEDYPVLKSAENFLFLQRELARTEEIIAMARSFHNDSILAYNNLRATIPGMVLSPFFPQKNFPTLSIGPQT